MLVSCLFVLIGLGLLVYGADVFVEGASAIARQLGISPLIIGLTIVGFATSAPEIIVGSVSAWQGKTAIAIGNALGSNIANIGLVLGVSVLLMPITVASNTIKREYIIMCSSIAIALLLMLDGYLNRADAALLLIGLGIVIGLIVWIARLNMKGDPLADEFKQELSETDPLNKGVIKFTLGLVLLLAGAEIFVRGAVSIAEFFGVSDLVIGLTIVAIGTSLPELAASITSLVKKEADIAIGNIVGSNMFNMLAVLSVPTLIQPTGFDREVLSRDFPAMIGLTVLLGIMVFITSKNKLIRVEGAILLLCFIGYQYVLFTRSVISA